ncbi:phage tail fiber protein [Paraburkholderia youngii]|uniref:phage tail fiber protein n=1 Tax=Paraburkholderia youngii TaxID=2782701 RepID=UPI003D1F3635
MATITSANSAFSLAVTNLYPTPQPIQGYAADDAFSADAIDVAEIVMGVDGHMSGGFVFNPTNLRVAIMPDSPSLEVFENWMTAQRTAREVYYCNGSISIPSIARKYSLMNGILRSGYNIVNAKRVLEHVIYTIAFERVIGERTAGGTTA